MRTACSQVQSFRCCLLTQFHGLQVNGIDSRPKNMKIAAGICASVGPLMFLGYFALQQIKKKKV